MCVASATLHITRDQRLRKRSFVCSFDEPNREAAARCLQMDAKRLVVYQKMPDGSRLLIQQDLGSEAVGRASNRGTLHAEEAAQRTQQVLPDQGAETREPQGRRPPPAMTNTPRPESTADPLTPRSPGHVLDTGTRAAVLSAARGFAAAVRAQTVVFPEAA